MRPLANRNGGQDRPPDEYLAMWKHFLLPGVVLRAGLLLVLMLLPAARLRAETGYDAWLRYARIDDKSTREQYEKIPATVAALGKSPVVKSAQKELIRGLRVMLGRTLRAQVDLPKRESAILLGTFDDVQQVLPAIGSDQPLTV